MENKRELAFGEVLCFILPPMKGLSEKLVLGTATGGLGPGCPHNPASWCRANNERGEGV